MPSLKQRFISSFFFYTITSHWRRYRLRNYRLLCIIPILLLQLTVQKHAIAITFTTPSMLPTTTVLSQGVTLFDDVIQSAAGPEHICTVDIDMDQPAIHLGLVQAYDRLV